MKTNYDTIIGYIGFTMATAPQLFGALNDIIKLLAGLGGLALLYYSIQHKRMLIKRDKKEHEKDN